MSLVHPLDQDKLSASLGRVEQGQEGAEETFRAGHRDGNYVWVTGIFQKMGDCIMPREGVFTKVIKGGSISAGDWMEIID